MKLIQNELIQNENSEQNSSKTLEQKKKFRTKFRTKIHNKNLEHTKIEIKKILHFQMISQIIY